MNLTEAKVICDSVSTAGKRITTLQLKYPRIIHGEMMTHRVFSRNASSSRAIPVEKMIADVRENMFVPEYWGKNQAGMQASEEVEYMEKHIAKKEWILAAEDAIIHSNKLTSLGVHKQLANRLLEPFQYIRVLVTSTEWDNFFDLRDHEDAQPEIQILAKLMRKAMDESEPVEREWHLPYVDHTRANPTDLVIMGEVENETDGFNFLAKISSARCARVSYMNHDGTKPDVDKDLKLFERLAGSKPIHASALEHSARAFGCEYEKSNNFQGWYQFREMYEDQMEEEA